MSTVWYAENRLKRPATIKFLKPELLAIPAIRQRFVDEAEALTRLNHPNIRAAYDYVETDTYLALVLEYLDGQDLNYFLDNSININHENIIKWILQALSALEFAHNQGIIHRDIKPANIFLSKDGNIKILDFGIAKIIGNEAGLTRTNRAIGSPMYMSPEQVKTPKDIDHRTDIYSIGVTMHALLSGVKPYNDETDSEFDILQKVVLEPLPLFPNSEKNKYNEIIQKATNKNKEQRFANCSDFISEIELINNTSILDKKLYFQDENTIFPKTQKISASEITIFAEDDMKKNVVEKEVGEAHNDVIFVAKNHEKNIFKSKKIQYSTLAIANILVVMLDFFIVKAKYNYSMFAYFDFYLLNIHKILIFSDSYSTSYHGLDTYIYQLDADVVGVKKILITSFIIVTFIHYIVFYIKKNE